MSVIVREDYVVDYECNSSSEQTKDYSIVGVVDYECKFVRTNQRLYNCKLIMSVIVRQNKPKTMQLLV